MTEEFSPVIMILIFASFTIGLSIGILLNRPKTSVSIPPDIERERTIAEVKETELTNLFSSHIEETEKFIMELAERQQIAKTKLKNQNTLISDLDSGDPKTAISPPKDYPDTHGQLAKNR